jgi:hypothetical protein
VTQLPVKESCNFRSGFVDFGPNSICDTEWNLFEIMQDRNKGFWSINRNHQPFGYSALIHGGSTCLFFRQTRVCDAIFFPVIHIQRFIRACLILVGNHLQAYDSTYSEDARWISNRIFKPCELRMCIIL